MVSNMRSVSKKIRSHILELVFNANASHVGSALSIADILVAVYYSKKLNFDPLSKEHSFVLSKGHACAALYAILFEKGLIKDDDFYSYGKDGSNLMHHSSHKVTGIELSTGSLGHGLSFTLGQALAQRIRGVHGKNICLIGDGELAEGSNWEAMLFASHQKINNLTLIIDNNNLQSLTTVADTLNLYPIDKKFEAFGWHVIEIDGHNFEQLENALLQKVDRPTVIIAKTIKGKGVSFMENEVKWHYKNPNEEEYKTALLEIKNA
jgi:transketolase